jgi:putative hydroxymethylpyrimidine transport system substrate-binding protein
MKKILFICIAFSVFVIAPGLQAAGAQKLDLMLDWFPNIDHLPVYVAKANGYFEKNGVDVKIMSPSETSDGLKLAAAGTVDLAVSYEPQTIIAASQGLDLQVVGHLVDHPLTTLMFLEGKGISTPSDLEGKTIGYTVPGLMDGLLDAFATLNNIKEYTPVNVGFTILPALASGKVDAVMGPFKTYETVAMAQHGYTSGYFELEHHGIPDYEELIFVCGKKVLADKAKAKAVHGFVRAIEQAMDYTGSHPAEALKIYLKQVPEADVATETQAFELTRPYYAATRVTDVTKWQAFADFALAHRLIEKWVDVDRIIYTWKE